MMITKVTKAYQNDEKKLMKKELKSRLGLYLVLGRELRWMKMTCKENQMIDCAT